MSVDPEQTVEQLLHLDSAVIDSSSLIYATKACFLIPLTATVSLFTVAGVQREVGEELHGIHIVDPRVMPRVAAADTVDHQVVAVAVSLGLPVISDDRKLLGKAEMAGCNYYNALMGLELLLLRASISLETYIACRQRLLSRARYSAYVLTAADAVHWEVRKQVG